MTETRSCVYFLPLLFDVDYIMWMKLMSMDKQIAIAHSCGPLTLALGTKFKTQETYFSAIWAQFYTVHFQGKYICIEHAHLPCLLYMPLRYITIVLLYCYN